MASAPTTYAWDETAGLPMLLAETTASGTTRYLYGPDGTVMERIDASAATLYYHQDQLGSTRALTDTTGNLVGTATYDPYGNTTATTGTITQPFGYAGQYTDPETGFRYLRARYYDPATARFLTRDPLEAITRDPYGYSGANPLNYTDPSGLFVPPPPIPVLAPVAVGVAVGVASFTVTYGTLNWAFGDDSMDHVVRPGPQLIRDWPWPGRKEGGKADGALPPYVPLKWRNHEDQLRDLADLLRGSIKARQAEMCEEGEDTLRGPGYRKRINDEIGLLRQVEKTLGEN